jgi:hypothetical protein
VINAVGYQPLPATEVWFANKSVSKFRHGEAEKKKEAKKNLNVVIVQGKKGA